MDFKPGDLVVVVTNSFFKIVDCRSYPEYKPQWIDVLKKPIGLLVKNIRDTRFPLYVVLIKDKMFVIEEHHLKKYEK